jgi:structure-specific recognition protein 1
MVAKKILDVVNSIGKLFLDSLRAQAEEDVSIDDMIEEFESPEFVAKLTSLVSRAQSKTTKLKDPAAPKRPPSNFMLFSKDKRESVKSEHPELKLPEISKVLGQKWRSLSDRKKEKYSKKAKALKEEYTKAMESYERPSDEDLADLPINKPKVRRSSSGKTKKKKDPNAPKGKKSAYMFFSIDPEIVQEAKDQLESGASRKEIVSEMGRLWKNDYLDEAVRKKWMKLAKKDKKRYEKEMEEYKPETEESEDKQEDADDGTCSYVPTRGKNKGHRCGKKIKGQGDYCASHKKTSVSRKNSKEVEDKVEDDDEEFEEDD